MPVGVRSAKRPRVLLRGFAALSASLPIAWACAPAPGARELSLAHFLTPGHILDEDVFTPFSERLEKLSDGRMTVKQYPGGALNSSPPAQYSILLGGVADIALVIPSYTSDVFPKSDIVGHPGVCRSAVECTEALQRGWPELKGEYRARVLAIWSNVAPVLLTRDKPVRTLEDLSGLKLRVWSRFHIPFVEALGASAVMQPATVLHQNLSTGVIDGVVISPTAIVAYRLHEPIAYITTWFPLSGLVFSLLMNREVYESLSAEERGWIDEAADSSLSVAGALAFERRAAEGMRLAEEAGVEIIEVPDGERNRFEEAIAPVYEAELSRRVGDMTVGEVLELLRKRPRL